MVSLKKSLFVPNKKCSNGRNSKLRREELRTLFSNWQSVPYYRNKYQCQIRMSTIPNEVLMFDQVPTYLNFHAIIRPKMTSVYQITDTRHFAGIKRYFDLERMLIAIELRQKNMMCSEYHAERENTRMIRHHHDILSRVLKDPEEEKL